MENDIEQWCVSRAECFVCGYEWTAVHPLGIGSLECDQCGSYDTARFDVEEGETE